MKKISCAYLVVSVALLAMSSIVKGSSSTSHIIHRGKCPPNSLARDVRVWYKSHSLLRSTARGLIGSGVILAYTPVVTRYNSRSSTSCVVLSSTEKVRSSIGMMVLSLGIVLDLICLLQGYQ